MMQFYKWNKFVFFALATAFVFVSVFSIGNLACAKPISRSEQEDINHRIKTEAEERQQREERKNVFLQEKTIKKFDWKIPKEKTAFFIKKIELEGQFVDKFPWTKIILDSYAGQSIGKEGINIIIKRLMEEFIDRGYTTTRIMVPEQDLSSGVLRLTLTGTLAGTLGDIPILS